MPLTEVELRDMEARPGAVSMDSLMRLISEVRRLNEHIAQHYSDAGLQKENQELRAQVQYEQLTLRTAKDAVTLFLEQAFECDKDQLGELLAKIWTAGHDQALRDVDGQQKQVLAAIKQANDSLEQAVKQRNALRDQLLALKRRGIR